MKTKKQIIKKDKTNYAEMLYNIEFLNEKRELRRLKADVSYAKNIVLHTKRIFDIILLMQFIYSFIFMLKYSNFFTCFLFGFITFIVLSNFINGEKYETNNNSSTNER